MKRALCVFFLACLAAGSQTITQNSFATSGTRGADVTNMSQNPAIGWRLTFWYTGFTAVTMQLDCAPDNGSGSAGAYAACSGAVDGTTNPVTISGTPQGGTIALKTYTPHIAVNPTSVTGSGRVSWTLTGIFGSTTAPTTVSTSGGGGGGGAATGCSGQAPTEVALSGTSYTQIIAASGSTKISLCNVAVTSASAGSPVINTFTFAFGVTNCTSPTEFMNLAGITGYIDQWFGTAQSAAGGTFCVKEATANSDKVTVTFLQQ